MSRPHPDCWQGDRYEHDGCRVPSDQTCIEEGCDEPAGTQWGPHWCPDCDVVRLDRIGSSLGDLAASVGSWAVR